MPSAKRFGVAVFLSVLLLAGCSGPGTQQPPQTTVSTTDETATVSKTAAETDDGTETTSSCRVGQSKYEVIAPEEPTALDETTAERVAVEYEKRYQRARHEAIYELSDYQSSLARAEVERTDDGFDVTVKVRVDARTGDGDQLSGGYPHTYRVSENGIVRDGTTVTCWNAEG